MTPHELQGSISYFATMAHQPLAGRFSDYFVTDNPRRSSDPIYSKEKKFHLDTQTTGCCGGGHHGCGCGCKTCNCQLTLHKDESNLEAYGGEGGRRGMLDQDVDLPDHASRFASSSASVRTGGSRSLTDSSFVNSFEVRDHFGGHHPASARIHHDGYTSEEHEDGHDAWPNYISSGQAAIHEDSSGMVIPGWLDDSTLALRGSESDLGQRSLLNSEYELSFHQPSATQSQVLTGAGATFNHVRHHFLVQPLRLSPECRHSTYTAVCAHCMH
jgi:hypothetical protein